MRRDLSFTEFRGKLPRGTTIYLADRNHRIPILQPRKARPRASLAEEVPGDAEGVACAVSPAPDGKLGARYGLPGKARVRLHIGVEGVPVSPPPGRGVAGPGAELVAEGGLGPAGWTGVDWRASWPGGRTGQKGERLGALGCDRARPGRADLVAERPRPRARTHGPAPASTFISSAVPVPACHCPEATRPEDKLATALGPGWGPRLGAAEVGGGGGRAAEGGVSSGAETSGWRPGVPRPCWPRQLAGGRTRRGRAGVGCARRGEGVEFALLRLFSAIPIQRGPWGPESGKGGCGWAGRCHKQSRGTCAPRLPSPPAA